MSNFEIAFERTLSHEGGYSDDAHDAGGKTRYGITEKEARAHGYTGDMEDLPIEFAKNIYRASYWSPLKCDEMAQEIAEEVFDTGVNMGMRRAALMLQQAINVFRTDEIVEDAAIGAKTLDALADAIKSAGAERVLKMLNVMQGYRYYEICRHTPTQKKFIRGWLNRVGV